MVALQVTAYKACTCCYSFTLLHASHLVAASHADIATMAVTRLIGEKQAIVSAISIGSPTLRIGMFSAVFFISGVTMSVSIIPGDTVLF